MAARSVLTDVCVVLCRFCMGCVVCERRGDIIAASMFNRFRATRSRLSLLMQIGFFPSLVCLSLSLSGGEGVCVSVCVLIRQQE